MNENNIKAQQNTPKTPGTDANGMPDNATITKILHDIQQQRLTVRPKKYFRLKLAVLIIVAIAVFVISAFLFSFILFSLSASGQPALFNFGPNGFWLFLSVFPWWLLALDLALAIFLGIFLRSFRLGYKTPVLYLLLIILGVIILAGFIVEDATSIHTMLLHDADQHELSVLDSLYEGVRRPPPSQYGVYRGTITSIDGTSTLSVALDNPMGIGTTTPIRVVLSPLLALEATSSQALQVGEQIFIAGDLEKGEIRATGIKITEELPPPAEDASTTTPLPNQIQQETPNHAQNQVQIN